MLAVLVIIFRQTPTPSSKMAPHPVKDVDLERKEELILAKQLRAARVTILPKVKIFKKYYGFLCSVFDSLSRDLFFWIHQFKL